MLLDFLYSHVPIYFIHLSIPLFIFSIYLFLILFLCYSLTSQSTVECSSLTGLNRHTILSQGLEEPRGIAVHPKEKLVVDSIIAVSL